MKLMGVAAMTTSAASSFGSIFDVMEYATKASDHVARDIQAVLSANSIQVLSGQTGHICTPGRRVGAKKK